MVFVLAAGIAGAVYLGAAIGAVAVVAALVLSLLIVFAIADRRSEADFFAVYAGQRGMTLSGRSPLPPATPLLRKGDDRYAEHAFAGPLAEGVDGVLALYTYEDESTDSEGNRQTNYYRYTVGLVDVPECAAHVPELFCRRKSGLRSLEKLEDAFRSTAAGQRWRARRWTSATRSSPAKSRTRSGCAGSSPPPSSSGSARKRRRSSPSSSSAAPSAATSTATRSQPPSSTSSAPPRQPSPDACARRRWSRWDRGVATSRIAAVEFVAGVEDAAVGAFAAAADLVDSVFGFNPVRPRPAVDFVFAGAAQQVVSGRVAVELVAAGAALEVVDVRQCARGA